MTIPDELAERVLEALDVSRALAGNAVEDATVFLARRNSAAAVYCLNSARNDEAMMFAVHSELAALLTPKEAPTPGTPPTGS